MLGLPDIFTTPIIALLFSAMLMPLLNIVANRTGFVDVPNARKIHSRPIPLLGGVAVYGGVIFALLARGPMDLGLALMMVASFLVMALGVVDDKLDLNSRYRLILQVAIAYALTFAGVRFHFFPFEPLDHIVTVLWIVGVINAMNCLDCADGTAGGTCLMIFLCLAGLSIVNGRLFVAQACLAGAGAVGGFLIFNFPPAKVFLGDTGSTFLGLMTAVLAILADPTPTTDWQLPIAPFALVVPVFDIIWVHTRRFQAGIRSPRELLSSNGKDHVPHRLMAHGLSKRGCTMIVALLSALAAGGVLALASGQWLIAAMAAITLSSILWHIEEGADVYIREDGVAIFRVDTPTLPSPATPIIVNPLTAESSLRPTSARALHEVRG